MLTARAENGNQGSHIGTFLPCIYGDLDYRVRSRNRDLRTKTRVILMFQSGVWAVSACSLETRHIRGCDAGYHHHRTVHGRSNLGLLRCSVHVGAGISWRTMGGRHLVLGRQTTVASEPPVRSTMFMDVFGQLIVRPLPRGPRWAVSGNVAAEHFCILGPLYRGRSIVEPRLETQSRGNLRVSGERLAVCPASQGLCRVVLVRASVHADRHSSNPVLCHSESVRLTFGWADVHFQ